MARRAETYKSETAKRLRDPKYADAYMKAAIYNHGSSFKEALAGMIDKFGHAELATIIDMSPPNVTRIVKRLMDDDDIKHDTLERLLSGFGLTLRMDTDILESKKKARNRA